MTTFVDAHRSDFNNSNTPGSLGAFADLLWRDHVGDTVFWSTFPSGMATLPTVTPDWHVKAAADFDGFGGDGNSDILWQNDIGALVLWQMEGGTVAAVNALPNPGPTWHIVGDNDFAAGAPAFGDDILWQNDNGALVIWSGISAASGTIADILAGTQNPGPTWHVVGTGDTSNTVGGSAAGILWQNDNGALVLWEDPTFAAGTFTFNTLAALPTVDPSWHVKGMADINGDHREDVVFQNDNGSVVVWEMGGTTIANANLINLNPGPAWHIVGLRDLNFDGHIDILFQNDNGVAAEWEDYQSLGGGSATFNTVAAISPNPNPNGHVWDLL